MEQKGHIAKVDEPTDWVSSAVYVKKRNGQLRVCLAITKTWNDLKPPKTTYNHLENFNNHLQPPKKHLQLLANCLKPSKTRHKCLK